MSKAKPSLDDLTPEQRSRLIRFKNEAGPAWKSELVAAWLIGADAMLPDGHLLRQIRNQWGPQWLQKLVLPENNSLVVLKRA